MDPSEDRGSRETYHSYPRNVAGAACTLLLGGGLVVGCWYAPNFGTWWSLPPVVAISVLFTVRFLRRVVVVTDVALTARGLFITRHLRWHDVRDVQVSERRGKGRYFRCHFCRGRRNEPIEISVRDSGNAVPFRVAVDRARTRAARMPRQLLRSRPRYEGAAHTRIMAGTWCAFLTMTIALLVLDVGIRDLDRYTARAARDRSAVAQVVSSRIDEHEDSEGDVSRSTRVHVVFTAADRQVSTAFTRDGSWSYTTEAELPIVYDSAHPRDADFGDRPNRRANFSRARSCTSVGSAVAALALFEGVGLAVLRWWPVPGRRRAGSPRRTGARRDTGGMVPRQIVTPVRPWR